MVVNNALLSEQVISGPTVRSRRYPLPDSLDSLTGPRSGFVDLPLRLYWNPVRRPFDITKPGERQLVYSAVLQEGTVDDICRYLNKDLLVYDWPTMPLPIQMAREWQNRFEELDGNETASW